MDQMYALVITTDAVWLVSSFVYEESKAFYQGCLLVTDGDGPWNLNLVAAEHSFQPDPPIKLTCPP
jgi:hypothetical protein